MVAPIKRARPLISLCYGHWVPFTLDKVAVNSAFVLVFWRDQRLATPIMLTGVVGTYIPGATGHSKCCMCGVRH